MTPFIYKQGSSILHNLDTRYKFVIMCLISMGILKALFPALAIISIVLIAAMLSVGIKPLNSFNHIKYFLILLIFIFISRALTTPGEPLFSVFEVPVSNSGIKDGALVSIRFLIIMLLGMIFSHTTKPSSIKSAAEWFLKPIPFIPEKRASLMIGLSIRFLPLIIEQAKQVSDAQKARCSDNQKNPVRKIARLILPILKKTFQTADNLALAMESRCFSEDRTDPEFNKSGYEIISLILTILLVLILILF
ncbi:MAG: energy-coupling factor transporter transmembrane protein EcfT [Desulfobacterales bacterium]|nr:energy-coupling factor transporter transmembrane protein EcfT [Desulfobacterales bacterium]